jgi:pyroglutamyl-peptidase
MKILVTGFDPFEGEPINPSWEAVRRLPDTVEGVEIIKVQLPTSFGRSADVVRAAILEHDPDVVVNVGEAGGQLAISPERVAINVDDGRIPDKDGNQSIGTQILADRPAAYFSSLPVKEMVTAMKKTGSRGVQYRWDLCLQSPHVSGSAYDRSRVSREAGRFRSRAVRPSTGR